MATHNDSLYAQYLLEREGVHVIFSDYGFISYNKMKDGSYYIVDIFVEKVHRNAGNALELESKVLDIAKADGAKRVIGSVCLTVNNATESMSALIRGGYKFVSQDQAKSMLYFEKEI